MRIRSSPLWAMGFALLCAGAPALAEPDPLEPYRERFQLGLDRFRAGDVLAAIQYWEAIRRQLGDQKAYRLMFNLGKAYEALGDATLAAERYEVFLGQADEHARQGPLDPAVQENVTAARERMESLSASHGRIRVVASTRPGLVRVDQGEPRVGAFRAFVAPGKHTVTIDPGTPKQRILELELVAGQEVDVDPTRPADPPPPVVPVTPAPVVAPPASSAKPAPTPSEVEPERPFPGYVLAISGGATVVSLTVPWLMRRRAVRISNEYGDPSTSIDRRRELSDDYDRAKTNYAVSWLVPAVFAGATGALTLWYLDADGGPVTVQGGVTDTSGTVQVRGRF